ncbi:MAG: diguanylate cyclase domain-containing protein [Egibacteraceae bacterium]
MTDDSGLVTYVSPAGERLLGWAPALWKGRRVLDLVEPDDRELLRQALQTEHEVRGGARALDLRVRDHTERERWVEMIVSRRENGTALPGWVLNLREITERKALEDELSHQAFHDALTGLANRALFLNRVEHAVRRRDRASRPLGVIFCDIDDFKLVNDSLGHAAGDELLLEVSRRLVGIMRDGDTAARLGGDEFALLLEDVGGQDGLRTAGERILETLQQPMMLHGSLVHVSVSVGGALHQRGEAAQVLLRNADLAMYTAKDGGK